MLAWNRRRRGLDLDQDKTKRQPVWPFSDPAFRGDPIEPLLQNFIAELDVHAEMSGSRFFNIQEPVGIATGIISFIDKYPFDALHDKAMLAEAERLIKGVQTGSDRLNMQYFRFGIGFALWQLSRSEMIADAEYLAWLQARQTAGPRERKGRAWQVLAEKKALEIWAERPSGKARAVAGEIHEWLNTADWEGRTVDRPASVETVERWLRGKGGREAFQPKPGAN